MCKDVQHKHVTVLGLLKKGTCGVMPHTENDLNAFRCVTLVPNNSICPLLGTACISNYP